MPTGKTRRAVLTALLAGCVSASCVTINIYFPAAAAEKAADRIIDEIYQLRKDGPAPAATPADTPAAKPAQPQSTPQSTPQSIPQSIPGSPR